MLVRSIWNQKKCNASLGRKRSNSKSELPALAPCGESAVTILQRPASSHEDGQETRFDDF